MGAGRSNFRHRAANGAGFRGMFLILWLAVLAGVIFLSVWPFNFDMTLATPKAWAAFWSSWGWGERISNNIANAAIFVPVGWLGMLAFRRWTVFLSVAMVAGVAAAVAFGVQAAQLFLEWRHATLVDFVWNMIGLVPGLALGLLFREKKARHRSVGNDIQILPWQILPWCIIALWVAYHLAPFVPTMDPSDITAKLVSAWERPWLGADSIFSAAAAWIAVGYLMRIGDAKGSLDRFLPLLMLAVLVLEVFILFRPAPGAADLIGAGAALLLWFGLLRRWEGAVFAVAAALAGRVVVDGLWPFTFEAAPVAPFYWLPFAGILGGSTWVNFLAITEKLFTFAAFGVALSHSFGSWRIAALLGGLLVFAVEWLQQYQPGHVPEITDPLMMVLVVAALAAFSDISYRSPIRISYRPQP